MSDAEKGLYAKYAVTRLDGRSEPGCKHADCQYFVLDITHDPFAAAAVRAYATACKRQFPTLAHDLNRLVAIKAVDKP
jgi:hypothetical protein